MYDCINLDRNAIIYKYYDMLCSITGPIQIHFQKRIMQNPIQIVLSSDIICFDGIRKICMFCQGTHPLINAGHEYNQDYTIIVVGG